MIGQTLAHYRITAALGAGGMGEVWRATDTKLGREVALKVLPAEFVDDPQRLDRFEREARAVASLNHPHIVTIHSVEEAEGVRFLTMELIEGQSLDKLIPEAGMEYGLFLDLATPLAEAISAAHDKSVIHRDLKPPNVMVDADGRLKVLDFGLAKLQEVGDPSDSTELPTEALTGIGTVVGTMPYMSPEQIEGEAVDHRTDIFSLGILLYEMAIGERPFQGKSSPALMSSILKDVPTPVVELRSDLPRHLGRIIGRCLEKNRRDRYQTARDVFNELKALQREASSMPPPGARSAVGPSGTVPLPLSPSAASSSGVNADEGFLFAVLPFKYSGGNTDIEALAEGLTEDIMTGLSRFSYLRIVARSSAAQFAGSAVDVRAVGEELGARYVMEGSLRQVGSRLRAAVQLVDATTGAHLWAETYNRPFDSDAVFDLQDDLAPRIVSTVADMNGVLPHSMGEALRGKASQELTPYEAMLLAFSYYETIAADDHAKAKDALERAVREAPSHADCWALLSMLYADEHKQGFNVSSEPLDRALEAARRATTLAPLNNLAYHMLAQAHFFRREFQAFRNAAEKAIALNPMDGCTMAFMGILMAYAGDWDHGCALAERAMELNPHHPGWYRFSICFNRIRQRDFEGALDVALKFNMPTYFYTHATLAAIYGLLGDMEAAGTALRELQRLKPDFAEGTREEYKKWVGEGDLLDLLVEGLEKAGLRIPQTSDSESSALEVQPAASPSSGVVPADEGFWVAVLPFKYTGGDADVTALAEGMTEEIVTGLSRFSYLRVVARGSAEQDSAVVAPIRDEISASYLMEGSLRLAGARLRLTVQLVDVGSGAHLWAETYDRSFSPESVFELQDDLVPRIVSTVADMHGILPRRMSEAVGLKPADQLTPYEALLHSFGYNERFTPEALAEARSCLERAVEQSPGNADCWAMLSLMYSNEWGHWDNENPEYFEKALQAARKAVQAAPLHSLPYHALAQALFFRREFPASRIAAERAVSLNPMDGATVAFMGLLIAYSGDWERGCALAERGQELNPNSAGMYHYTAWHDAYGKKDYRRALDLALKLNTPENFYQHAVLAMCYAQLGEMDTAHKSLQDMLALKPDYGKVARKLHGKWIQPDLVEQLMDGLRKAGLEIADEEEPGDVVPVSLASGEQRMDEGFWVAVLPFKYTGGDADVTALAEGLSEDIVTGLSRFSYLRVIKRSSTLNYAREGVDVGAVGDELGARYVMEGSLRQAGNKLRVAVQLVDTVSGAHLWAEAYDRDFVPEELFALQDDLVPRIVSTCADHFGVLARAISEAVRERPLDEITPYEALMRGFGYHFRLSPEEHAEAREVLEQAVEQAPSNADCWAMLAWVYSHEFAHDFNPRPNSLDRALDAARRAVDIAPSNHLAQQVLAVVLFFRKETEGCLSACERALALNPLDGSNEAIFLIAFSGDWERGCALIRRAMELNPHHPGWYRSVLGTDEYRKGNYRAAVEESLRANVPGLFWTYWMLAAAYGQLGELTAARKALADLLARKEDFARTGRQLMEKWLEPELVEHLMDGLSKAGLDGAPPGSRALSEAASRGERHTVGRQPELDDLRSALEAAREGRGSLVLVTGEPGIGKTTLVESFLADAAASGGCTFARGRCSERLAGSDAYLPVLEALDSLLQGSDRVAAERSMKQVAPVWYAQIAPLSGDSGELAAMLEQIQAATQERMKLDFVTFVQEVSRSRPLVLFLDDLHWADVSSIDLLSFLAGKLDGSNVLVIATYRPSDMLLSKHAFLQIKPDLQTRGLCRELQLEFLQESEVADYLELEFPGHRFPRDISALIHARTEGSPLFMADLVRYLRDQGAIAEVDGEWKLRHGLPEIQRELPESVRGMIERKLGQLGEDDHTLLAAASVQGYVFDSAVVAQVLGLPADDVEERLDKLDRVYAFVKVAGETELPDHTLTLRYRFVHVLYQNALYASLRPTRKAALSREVGQALERAHGEKTSDVAHELAALYETGRDFARAAEFYLMAAGQASRVFADREAASLATSGITLVEKLDLSPDRARRELELQLALGQALRTTMGYGHPDTGKAYSRARELCHDIGEAPQLFPVLHGLWEFLQNQGELESAVEVGEQMLVLAKSMNDPGLLVAAHGVMADNLLCVGDPAAAREHAAQAIALYDPDKHQSLASMFGYDSGVAAHCMTALALWQAGYPDQAVRSSNAAADLANSLSHPPTLAFGAFFASWIQHWTGGQDVSQKMADRCVEISTEFDLPALLALGQVGQGWASIAQGHHETGMVRARAGVEGLQASGFIWARSFCLGVVAEGCAGAGRLDEALAVLEEAFAHADGTGERFFEAELLRLKGEYLLRSETRPEPTASEGCFLQAIEVAKRQQAVSWELRATTSLARLWQGQGRFAEAHECLEQVYSRFTEGFETSDVKVAKELLTELDGLSKPGHTAT